MAGRPSAAEKTQEKQPESKRVKKLRRQHERAQDRLAKLLEGGGESQEDQRERAIAERIMWSSTANWLNACERFKEASDCSATSARHAEVAIKLVKATLGDRVYQLEQIVKRAQTAGNRVRGEAQARRQ